MTKVNKLLNVKYRKTLVYFHSSHSSHQQVSNTYNKGCLYRTAVLLDRTEKEHGVGQRVGRSKQVAYTPASQSTSMNRI